MRTLKLTKTVPDEVIDPLLGSWPQREHYDTVVDETCRVEGPDGELVGLLLRGAITPAMCNEMAPILRTAANLTDNRGSAAGPFSIEQYFALGRKSQGRFPIKVLGGRVVLSNKSGGISKRTRAKEVHSGIIGYVDPTPVRPYCRMTAWTMRNMGPMKGAMKLIELADALFKEHAPDRHAAQMEIAQRTNPDFRLGNTSFTTVTVNRNFRTGYHRDAGDYRPGFGVLCCIRNSKWTGGLFVMPKYRTAFNMENGDVLLANVHEMHGNTAMIPRSKNWERITCVFYHREKVARCGSAEEELRKAQARPARPVTKKDA